MGAWEFLPGGKAAEVYRWTLMRCGVLPFPLQALHGVHRDSFTFCLLPALFRSQAQCQTLPAKWWSLGKQKETNASHSTLASSSHTNQMRLTCGKQPKQSFDNNCTSPGSKTVNLPNFTAYLHPTLKTAEICGQRHWLGLSHPRTEPMLVAYNTLIYI